MNESKQYNHLSESVSFLKKELEAANEKLETLLNALPVGIVIIDYKIQKIIEVRWPFKLNRESENFFSE